MPKCQDVRCPSTPITDHNRHGRGVPKVLQDNRDHVRSSFHDESHHRNALTDSCIKKGKEKEKKKKREKNTKPANQRNKKRNRKHKLKLLSLGEVTIYEGIKMKIYRKSFHRIFPADSIRCCCPLPAAPGAQGPLRLWLLYFQGWVSGGKGKARNGLVGEALGPQPKDWKLNVILSKSHLYPGVPFLTWKWGGKNAALLTVLRKMPEWFFLLKTIKISWRHILTWCINSWLN